MALVVWVIDLVGLACDVVLEPACEVAFDLRAEVVIKEVGVESDVLV